MHASVVLIALLLAGCKVPQESGRPESGSPDDSRGVDTGCQPAEESCDGFDNDCDGMIDEGFDADGDGAPSAAACVDGTDCDDTDPGIGPGQTDLAGDGLDTDCDGCDDDCRWLGGFTADDASARFQSRTGVVRGRCRP